MRVSEAVVSLVCVLIATALLMMTDLARHPEPVEMTQEQTASLPRSTDREVAPAVPEIEGLRLGMTRAEAFASLHESGFISRFESPVIGGPTYGDPSAVKWERLRNSSEWRFPTPLVHPCGQWRPLLSAGFQGDRLVYVFGRKLSTPPALASWPHFRTANPSIHACKVPGGILYREADAYLMATHRYPVTESIGLR